VKLPQWAKQSSKLDLNFVSPHGGEVEVCPAPADAYAASIRAEAMQHVGNARVVPPGYVVCRPWVGTDQTTVSFDGRLTTRLFRLVDGSTFLGVSAHWPAGNAAAKDEALEMQRWATRTVHVVSSARKG